MTDKNGVEIDYCPSCRGIWLDRGELDKILERSADHYSVRDNYERDQRKYSDSGDRRYPHKKKKSFFGDFFDFD